ncbi:MAG TPA: pitrilysin family protein [Candidatus Gastranaerophilales bacterium]|nr:pitrilysin family protein [Candidatus Gastranaerophilales bacterium]
MTGFQNINAYPQKSNSNYNNSVNLPVNSGQTVYSFNPCQAPHKQSYYQYPQPNNNGLNNDINSVMRSQMMPVQKQSAGYKEISTFDAPYLNTKGKLYKLDNGQGVVIIPKKGATTIKTFVKVGSFNEQKHRGISHYIEHNLFNGSKDLAPNQFVEEVTGMGGIYNASTDTADTDYFIKSPLHEEGDLEKFLTMHANMLHFPEFTDNMLEKEKGPVISEIQMYQDNPSDKAYNEMIKNLYGIKTDYQGLIAGSTKVIKNLTKQDVVDYYKEWYTPDNMVTVIVGDVDSDKAIKLASKLFNKKQAAPQDTKRSKYYEPLNLIEKTVRKDITSPQIDSVMLMMGMAGPANNNAKETISSLGLVTALTGHENARLIKALKPINADVMANVEILSPDYNAPQLMHVGAYFKPGKEENGLKTIYSVLQNIVNQPPTQEEMFLIRNKLEDNLLSASESSMNIADMVGNAVVGHGDLGIYANISEQINNLTSEDIQSAAKKYLDLNRASIVMVHPEKQQQIAFSGNKNVNFKGDSEKFKFTHIKEYDLPNNLRVVINDCPYAIKAGANLKLKTDDIKSLKPGAADILSVMMNKGTKNYSEDQLNQIINTHKLGISAGAEGRSINLTANCPKEKLPVALRIMKEILYNPDFTPEKFDEAKEKIKLQYSSIPKDPADKALQVLYPDYLWGVTPAKVLKNIDNVTLHDVQELHKQITSDSQGIVAIDGPISATSGLGDSLFMELQSGIRVNKPCHPTLTQESKPLEQNLVLLESEQRSQADIVQVFKIKESGNIKDHAALLLLNEVLGGNSLSRLFMDLRETQKLAYRVKSIYNTDGKYGNIALTIKTTTEDDLKGRNYENLIKSIDGFKSHINKLVASPVSDKELATAKRQVKTDINTGMDFAAESANMLQSGFNTLYGSQYNNSLYDALEQLTPKDIQNAAKLYLTQPSVISLIASPDTIKNTKPYLESLGKIQAV